MRLGSRDGLAVTFAEFRDRRKIYDIESYSRQQFKAEVIPGMEPSQRAPQEPRGGDFGGGRGAPGRSYDNRDNPSRGRFGGPARGGYGDRGGFGGGFGGGRDDRGFAPRRDSEGYGRKPGFGDAGRGGFAPRGEAGAPRGDYAPRKPAFAKPAGAGGAKPFVAHDARKRPARPAR